MGLHLMSASDIGYCRGCVSCSPRSAGGSPLTSGVVQQLVFTIVLDTFVKETMFGLPVPMQ